MANSPRLAELADLITRREYNYAICRARKHEEDLVRRYAKDHDMEYTTLADTIEELYQAEIIGDASRENLHMIRRLGNKAVHEADNDASDAKAAYDMLKRELTTYSDQKYTNPERTPVALRRDDGNREIEMRRRMREREAGPGEGGIDISFAGNGRRRADGNQPGRRGGRYEDDGRKQDDSTLYTILKVLIPVLIIVLLVVLAINIFKDKEVEETTAAPTTIETSVEETEPTTPEETTVEETTTVPETEPPVTYQIKGEGVNIRFASDPSQIATQLPNGQFIGTVKDYENNTGNDKYDNFVQFTYNGKEVIVRKDFITESTSNQ